MKHIVCSIVLLALVAHSCMAAIVIKPPEFELIRVNEAVIDILVSCYGDPGNAIGILGDVDGSILKTLWTKYFIPTVLIDREMEAYNTQPSHSKLHRLQVFLIVTDSWELVYQLYKKLFFTVWWNHNANVLILNNCIVQCNQYRAIYGLGHISYKFGMLNVQIIYPHRTWGSVIFTMNPFTNRAPKHWTFFTVINHVKLAAPLNFFFRQYRAGGQVCKDLNFDKTIDIGGYPFYFEMEQADLFLNNKISSRHNARPFKLKTISESAIKKVQFLMDNIVIGLNATAIIMNSSCEHCTGIDLNLRFFSDSPEITKEYVTRMIMPLIQNSKLAVTQHTRHMSQLDKILSVIDRKSRIGMWVVYLITFLFFKFFLRQTVVSALLNLMRLTCNTGLTKLPRNVSATIYLACLFMFVVTLQAIYTGNLATLLTTTIAYPNVQTINDIANLGYKVYNEKNINTKLIANPILDGRFIEIPNRDNCSKYILRDPLGICVTDFNMALIHATIQKLHVSRDTIIDDYWYLLITWNNPFQRRIDFLVKELSEHGLWKDDKILETFHNELVDDDEVKKNVQKRVMTLADLCFAFVILGIGLTCSIVCFIGEIVIYRILLRMANRRDRVRVRIAWGVTKKKCSRFPSFNLRFNARRLLSIRR